ncbi:MAG: sulfatase-like hydrolase/transferase [Actinomycetota bacterium]
MQVLAISTLAPLVFLVLSFSSGDRDRLIFPEGDARAEAAQLSSRTPVVEVVFDGLPTATLMNRSGKRINAKRFPGFAKLADQSTWYRNNTTVADFTGRAIPAIETGINPGYRTLPIASEHPNSIFTLLGGEYEFNVHEPVTRVCPQSLCPRSGPNPGGEGLTAGEFAQEMFVKPRPRQFKRFLDGIPPHGRSFNFIHFEVPHEPFHFLPDGRSYNFTPISDVANHNGQKWAGGRGGTATTWQRHYIQTGYADTLTRRMIRRVKRAGIWNEALVIVTADHGMSFDPRTFRRIAFPGNFGGIANPVLFIKYPGQTEGAVSNLHTSTIDIVPTTAQVLGIELPYETDGVPISEAGYGGSIRISNAFNKVAHEPFRKFRRERRRVLRRAARQLGSHTGLFQLGPRSSLLGRRARASHGGSAANATLDSRLDFRPVVLGGGRKVPAFVNGTIGGSAAGSVIAIAVNGRIVATCRAFRFKGQTRWGAVVPPSALHSGSNSVGVYLARRNRLVRLR